MQDLALGDSGVNVSALCLGIMNFGTRDSEEVSFALLDQYRAAGGAFIDTANCYAWWNEGGQGGESESLLGRYLKARGCRKDLFIATKVGFQYPPVPTSLKGKLILEEADKSLRRMGIDHIDLYYAHRDDPTTPLEETLEAFAKLVKAGKVRLIGGSNYPSWRMEESLWVSRTHGWPAYCCVQQRFTYLRANPGASFAPQLDTTPELQEWCKARGKTLLAYSPLLSGAYSRPERKLPQQYVGKDSELRLAELKKVAAETGATVNQVIYAWMLQSDPPIIPLMAASTAAQMKENLGALDVKLTPQQNQRLTTAGLPAGALW